MKRKMSDLTDSVLVSLEHNVTRLLAELNKYKKESMHLQNEVERLNNIIENNNKKVDELEKKLENVKLANVLQVSGQSDTHNAKIKINRLVREIDNCISLLNC